MADTLSARTPKSRPARLANRLPSNAATAASYRQPGKYGDGDGLWLVVTTPSRRAWVFRYMHRRKAREMSLGTVGAVTLAQARDKAADARRLLAADIDPLDARQAIREAEASEAAPVVTFAEAAERFVTHNEKGWRNPKHRQQWRNTLATYAAPVIGSVPVADVNTDHVLRVIGPIWPVKPETASRVRGRIEAVLDYAKVQGWRTAPNAAGWRGHLEHALPSRRKVRAAKHHAALDWREMPAFMAKLRERDSTGARALEFAILTAARSGEVRGATWGEIDRELATWTVPAQRIKGGRAHRIPVSAAALTVLEKMAALRTRQTGDALVFPGMRQGRPLSDMSLTAVLRRMGRGELTAHGFRSTFRDWCAEATEYPREVAEAALAHAVGDKTEAAYFRTDLFDRRRALMSAWADFCTGNASEQAAK